MGLFENLQLNQYRKVIEFFLVDINAYKLFLASPSAVIFGGIIMAGAFAVKYTGTMVLQVRTRSQNKRKLCIHWHSVLLLF